MPKSSRAHSITPKKTRVLLLVLQGVLREVLPQHLCRTRRFQWVKAVDNLPEGRALLRRALPDVAAIDLALDAACLKRTVKEFRKWTKTIRIIVFNAPVDHGIIGTALRLGVLGYLSANAPVAELLQALEKARTGERYLSSSVAHLLQEGYAHWSDVAPKISIFHLTDREEQITMRRAHGQPNKAIAKDLSVSVRTVEKHLQNARQKQPSV